MKRTIIVNVDAFCIDHGKQKNCKNCPVAMALGRHALWPHSAKVTNSNWVVHQCDVDNVKEGYNMHVVLDDGVLPWMASEFISQFDSFGPEVVKPFEFSLEVKGDWFYDVT